VPILGQCKGWDRVTVRVVQLQTDGCTIADFTFCLRLLLSQFAEQSLKLNAKVRTYTRVELNFGLSMY